MVPIFFKKCRTQLTLSLVFLYFLRTVFTRVWGVPFFDIFEPSKTGRFLYTGAFNMSFYEFLVFRRPIVKHTLFLFEISFFIFFLACLHIFLLDFTTLYFYSNVRFIYDQ